MCIDIDHIVTIVHREMVRGNCEIFHLVLWLLNLFLVKELCLNNDIEIFRSRLALVVCI